MTLQDISTTQETSRKLKEAGFPQEGGIAYWLPLSGEHLYTNNPGEDWKLGLQIDRTDWFYIPNRCAKERSHTKYRAFTFNELWDLLPDKIGYHRKDITFYTTYDTMKEKTAWGIGYYERRCDNDGCEDEELKHIENENLLEAAAELALWCVKEGYLNL